MCARLKPALISFPTSMAAFEQCASAFMRRSGIPNIIGAIDGSHIRVAPPKRHQKSYYNRKKFYSVILSAVCDARGAFLSCDVGFPGRMSGSRVLKYVRARLLRWWLCAVPHHPPSPCHLQVLPPLQVRGAVVREPWLLPLRRRRLPAALVAHGGLPES